MNNTTAIAVPCQDLVIAKRNQAKTTSLLVAETFGKPHKDVLQSIRNLPKKGCSKDFNGRNFAPVEYVDGKGEQRPYYEMTKDGFTILVMGYTGKKAMQFKEQYIRQFNRMESHIRNLQAMKNDPDRQIIRDQGKAARRDETDTIQRFVEYAINQGSKSANRYYNLFTRMTNNAMFCLSEGLPKPKNLRSILNERQLLQIMYADGIVEAAIQKGMGENLPYKQIYQEAKARIQTLASITGVTQIGAQAQEQGQLQLPEPKQEPQSKPKASPKPGPQKPQVLNVNVNVNLNDSYSRGNSANELHV